MTTTIIKMEWRRIYDPTTGERRYDTLTDEEQAALTENAVEHVFKEITVAGHTSGQLIAENADGWWSISTEEENPEIVSVVIPRETLAKLSAKTLEKLGLSISKNTPQFKGRMKNGK